MNVLDEKAKGEALPVKSATLGLKSRVSLDLKPFFSNGTSLKLSFGYEPTVNTSPVSFVGTTNLSNITLTIFEGTVAPSFLTILE